MLANLGRINRVLEQSWFDLEVDDEDLLQLEIRLSQDPDDPPPINMSHRRLYRVFNDPDLRTGGRFYGGWWQNIPKTYRSRLLVNGKRMVEYDYSYSMPSKVTDLRLDQVFRMQDSKTLGQRP